MRRNLQGLGNKNGRGENEEVWSSKELVKRSEKPIFSESGDYLADDTAEEKGHAKI